MQRSHVTTVQKVSFREICYQNGRNKMTVNIQDKRSLNLCNANESMRVRLNRDISIGSLPILRPSITVAYGLKINDTHRLSVACIHS